MDKGEDINHNGSLDTEATHSAVAVNVPETGRVLRVEGKEGGGGITHHELDQPNPAYLPKKNICSFQNDHGQPHHIA